MLHRAVSAPWSQRRYREGSRKTATISSPSRCLIDSCRSTVNHDIRRNPEPDVSHSYHNRGAHVTGCCLVCISTCAPLPRTRLDSLGFVLEIGCGSGYWAWLMTQQGVSVRAFDTFVPTFTWHTVRYGNELAAVAHPDWTLLLCWPPYGSGMAFGALIRYRGRYVIYVRGMDGWVRRARVFSTL